MALRKPLFTKAQLRELADEGSWDRGVKYFTDKRVTTLLEDRGVIVAKVMGTNSYRVRLSVDGKQLIGECTCPLGDEGVFCKHCVAAGLAYLDDGEEFRIDGGRVMRGRSSGKARRRTVDMEDVREYLAKRDPSALVEIIMEQTHVDDALRRRLLTKTALHTAKAFDADAFRLAIQHATKTNDFLDFNEASDLASGLDEITEALENLVRHNHAAEAISLIEYALARVENVLNHADDSSGMIGEASGRLQELHHRACVAAKPDPVALARRIFHWQLDGSWDTFYGAPESYADVLGKNGLAAYRKLAEAEWTEAKPPEENRYSMTEANHRWTRLKRIMESLAKATGDIESLVAVNVRDIRSSYDYLQIATMYRDAGKSDKAMECAEKGLKAFPDQQDRDLRLLLAEEYHRRKCHDEAMALIWANFTDHPGLRAYQDLHKHAWRIDQWPAWRERALSHIRAGIAEPLRKTGERVWDWRKDHSTLVEVFVWEKRVEDAWEEAKAGGCSDELWIRLAKWLEKDRPADAIPVYQGQVQRTLRQTGNEFYRRAVQYIRKIEKLLKRVNRSNEFRTYLQSLRSEYRRKRNFVAMLDKLG